MSSYVEHVLAALPYRVSGSRVSSIIVDVDMDRLTILVGPNASGKTAILEALGFALAMHLDAKHSVLGIALTTTLRPRAHMPQVFVGKLTLTSDGVVKARGRWSGRAALRSIEELGADLRR